MSRQISTSPNGYLRQERITKPGAACSWGRQRCPCTPTNSPRRPFASFHNRTARLARVTLPLQPTAAVVPLGTPYSHNTMQDRYKAEHNPGAAGTLMHAGQREASTDLMQLPRRLSMGPRGPLDCDRSLRKDRSLRRQINEATDLTLMTLTLVQVQQCTGSSVPQAWWAPTLRQHTGITPHTTHYVQRLPHRQLLKCSVGCTSPVAA
jgi:hypothetical protein